MFKKLRNKLILTNLGISTVVLVAALSMVYGIITHSANNRPPVFREMTVTETQSNDENVDETMREYVTFSLREEKNTAARELLVSLVVSGVIIEVAVIFISYLMAEEAIKPVREAYEAQKIFIANASHEIKTPLAAISANLEAADIQNNHWIDNIETETAKLTALNTELLTLARADIVKGVEAKEVDLKPLVERAIDSFRVRLGDKKLSTKINLPKKVKINSEDFLQILSILMDNALKYSDKKIAIDCDKATLVVRNDGKGIDKKELSHVFDRFYQADKSAEGVGLGLAIAKTLAERNGWKIVASSGGKGAEFTLQFD